MFALILYWFLLRRERESERERLKERNQPDFLRREGSEGDQRERERDQPASLIRGSERERPEGQRETGSRSERETSRPR